MKKLGKIWRSFKDEVSGFLWVIGLRTDAQRLAIGLLMACGIGEAIQRL